MKTEFILPFPPTVNSMYANSKQGRHKSKKYNQWIIAATNSLWGQKINHHTGRVKVTYYLEVPDKRKRDCANYEKGISDLLTKLGIIKDDSFIRDNRQVWADDGCDWKGVKCVIEDI